MLARIVINWWKLKIATDSQLLVESCSRHAWHCEWWVCRKRFGMRSMYFVRFGFSHVNIKRKTFFLLKTALNWTELWRIEVFVRCGSRQNQTRINVHYRTRNEPPTPMCLALNDAFFSPSALTLFSVHFVGIVESSTHGVIVVGLCVHLRHFKTNKAQHKPTEMWSSFSNHPKA